MEKVVLALGSNLGDRKNNILAAIKHITEDGVLTGIRASSLLNNKAICPKDAPEDWDKDFINCVVVGNTELEPMALLSAVKKIERSFGRIDTRRWAPREIDIDILLYGSICMATSTLTLPHVELLNRQFAVSLLAEIEPDLCYPGQGEFYNKSFKSILMMTTEKYVA